MTEYAEAKRSTFGLQFGTCTNDGGNSRWIVFFQTDNKFCAEAGSERLGTASATRYLSSNREYQQ